jgi:16S rRNA G1207 methylase RsmC
MELYINNSWTEINARGYVAEAIAWSENGNHATIYATGNTADEANTRLMNALRELNLAAEISVIGDACSLTDSESPDNASSGGDEVETDKR